MGKRRPLVVLLGLLLGASFTAAPAAVQGQDGIPTGTTFDVPFVVGGKAVVAVAEISTGGSLRVIYVSTDGKIKFAYYTLTRKDSPNPNPQPDPKPDPLPPPAELLAIVVEETAERTPQQGIVLASAKLRALFPKLFRVTDKDSDSADVKPYIERAKGKTLPMLWLVDAKGTVYFEGALPATVAAFEALHAKHKGAKR